MPRRYCRFGANTLNSKFTKSLMSADELEMVCKRTIELDGTNVTSRLE